MVQVILWAILGGTLGVAALVVRHKRLVGAVELAEVRTVDLPGGVVVGVRLPKGWAVEHDPAEHGGAEEMARTFEADEPAGGVGGTPGPGAGDYDRGLIVRFEPLSVAVSAREQLDHSGLLSQAVKPSGGTMTVAGVDGCWVAFGRPMAVPRGPMYHPAYAAVGVVPAGPATPGPIAVTVVLDCPPGDVDEQGDHDLLRRVAAAVTVERNRAPAVPSIHPPPGR